MWSEAYGEAYSTTKPNFFAWNRHHAVTYLIPPLLLFRVLKWRKHTQIDGRRVSQLPVNANIVPVATAQPVGKEGGGDGKVYDIQGKVVPSAQYSAVGVPVTESRARPDDSPLTMTLVPILAVGVVGGMWFGGAYGCQYYNNNAGVGGGCGG